MALTEYHVDAAVPSNVIDLAARRASRAPRDPQPTTPAPVGAASVARLNQYRDPLLLLAAQCRAAADRLGRAA